jgi:hypothetical protein
VDLLEPYTFILLLSPRDPHFPHLVRYHWAPGLDAGFVGEHSRLSTSGVAAPFPLYWIDNWLLLIIA